MLSNEISSVEHAEKICGAKKQFTKTKALAIAHRLRKHGYLVSDKSQVAYKCPACGAYHVGRCKRAADAARRREERGLPVYPRWEQ